MCGFSAIIVNKKNKKNNLNFKVEIQKMNNAISHRGPDDEGYLN